MYVCQCVTDTDMDMDMVMVRGIRESGNKGTANMVTRDQENWGKGEPVNR